MPPCIAIPLPLASDPEYVARSLPQYERALQMAGGEPVRVPLDQSVAELGKIMERCSGVLLPGSKTDVDPAKYGSPQHEKTAPPDAPREAVDSFLLEQAYSTNTPILAICYGLQSLNVFRAGTLIQHIPDFLLRELHGINHAAGRNVAIAHEAEIDPGSTLAQIVSNGKTRSKAFTIPVNSSHHQAADKPGEGLRIVARCPSDGIIEALESTDRNHFVVAVQWHPERSRDDDEPSRAIFRAFVDSARQHTR